MEFIIFLVIVGILGYVFNKSGNWGHCGECNKKPCQCSKCPKCGKKLKSWESRCRCGWASPYLDGSAGRAGSTPHGPTEGGVVPVGESGSGGYGEGL
jgi:hypothetical protein